MLRKKLTLLMLLFVCSSSVIAADEENSGGTLIHEVPYSFEETVKRTREAIYASNYRVFPERYLEQGLADEVDVNTKQVTLRFCNFKTLDKAMKIEPRIGVVLPCKVTVIENDEGKVKLIVANVAGLSELFENKALAPLEQAIIESYEEIIDEVTL
jgi:cytochrome c oxidase cbb3-type subunit 3